MKLFAMALVLFSMNSFAQQSVSGRAELRTLMGGAQLLTISGTPAKNLYNSMRAVRPNSLGQKVGNNITCIKNVSQRGATSYQCDLTVDDAEGTIGPGAAG